MRFRSERRYARSTFALAASIITAYAPVALAHGLDDETDADHGAHDTSASPAAAHGDQNDGRDDPQDEHQDHGHREAGAHEHGRAALEIVQEGGALTIVLRGALWSFLGFERAPETQAERDAVDAARAALASPDAFSLSKRAGCVRTSSELSLPLIDAVDPAKPEADGETGPHQTERQIAESHDDWGDLSATFAYDCARPERLDTIDAGGLFSSFQALEALDAAWVGDAGDAAAALSSERSALTLKRR